MPAATFSKIRARLSGPSMTRFGTVASRYGALLTQFLIIILIARHLTKADAGVYLLIFGAVASTAVFAGFGASDTLIKRVPELIAANKLAAVRPELRRSFLWTATASLPLLAAMVGLGAIVGHNGLELVFFALWWIAFSCVFVCGQALVAMGRDATGAFVWYALNNRFTLFTTAPYLLLANAPTAAGALAMSVLAAYISATAGIVLVIRAARAFPAGGKAEPPAYGVKLGLIIASARTVQAMLYWIPAWMIAVTRGPADAATVSTAGRLLIAATAVIAVFRFTVRANVVLAAERGDWPAIERMSRLAATISTAAAVAALLVIMVAGGPLIALVFGPNFRDAAPVLAVLLVGAVGESLGGPVDEVLRYTGHATTIFHSLLVAVIIEAALAYALSGYGPVWAATAQALAFCGMYAFQIIYCRRKLGIIILPYLSPAKLRLAASES